MKTARRTERKSFSKIDAQWNLQIPNLLEVQLKSFRDFLQMDVDPMRRRNEGLQEVFTGVFPISDILDALPAATLIDVEVPSRSKQQNGIPALERIRPAVQATRALLDRAQPTR